MPAGVPQFGDGTTLEVNDGAAAAFVPILECESITPPASEVAIIPRKRLSNVAYKEKLPSLTKDLGNLAFSYEVTDVLQVRLEALVGLVNTPAVTTLTKTWRVTLPDGLRFSFTGFLQSAKPGAAVGDGIVMGTGTVVVTSLLALTDTIP